MHYRSSGLKVIGGLCEGRRLKFWILDLQVLGIKGIRQVARADDGNVASQSPDCKIETL